MTAAIDGVTARSNYTERERLRRRDQGEEECEKEMVVGRWVLMEQGEGFCD